MSSLVVRHIVDCDTVPSVSESCSIEEHKKDGQLSLEMSKVKLHLSRNQVDGSVIEGNKLREELASKPVLNANVLDYLLLHQVLIPEEWKRDANKCMRWIFFWGTIYRNSNNNLFVRYLFWNNGMWDWGYHRLDNVWSKDSSAAILEN